jgi:hypothetical protein
MRLPSAFLEKDSVASLFMTVESILISHSPVMSSAAPTNDVRKNNRRQAAIIEILTIVRISTFFIIGLQKNVFKNRFALRPHKNRIS